MVLNFDLKRNMRHYLPATVNAFAAEEAPASIPSDCAAGFTSEAAITASACQAVRERAGKVGYYLARIPSHTLSLQAS